MALNVEWRAVDGEFRPFYQHNGKEEQAVWAPQPGSQTVFLNCPITEVLYEGTRGPGKTDALLMAYGRHVGKGYGEDWKGIIFRRTYPELQDVIEKSRKWFKRVWPSAEYNEGKSYWEWADGERLYFRHFLKPVHYWGYHGHSYPFIGWEELTTWPTDDCFKSMFACSRSTRLGMPRMVRSTTNPYGVGHNWVKRRYRLPVQPGQTIGNVIRDSRDESGTLEPPRVAIHGYLDENVLLMRADPDYKQRISAAARNKNERKAWLEGSWDIVAGGMLDDVWERAVHTIEPFPIPAGWIVDRAFDWGSSKPFALGWWAESDGTLAPNGKLYPKGTLFLVKQWYGWTGKENVGLKKLAADIAKEGLKLEKDLNHEIIPGPADPSIFAVANGMCIANDMIAAGMPFEPGQAGPGSRKNSAELLRTRLEASLKWPMEKPGMFIFKNCEQWLRTVPVIPRDLKDPDDVDTESEDHDYDMTRYRIMHKRRTVQEQKLVGV